MERYNIWKNGFIFLICVWLPFLTLPLAADPWLGNGSDDNPYQIADANDLATLADDANFYGDNFILTADIDLAGKDGLDYIIAPDLAGSGAGPYFSGTFDGNYHVIKNLTINTLGSNYDFLGLFGIIGSEGMIQYLGVESTVITGGDSSDRIGILAGGNLGTISKCYATGVVTGGLGSQDLGGLVGYNVTAINCYADVLVTGGASSTNVGGFAGSTYFTTNCYASGMVSGGTSVGGFAGSALYAPGIQYCYFLHPLDGGGPDNGVGIVLTEEEMEDQTNFFSWDFFGEVTNGIEEIWTMDNFPILAWQVPVGMKELALLSQYWLISPCSDGELCQIVDWYMDGTIDINDLNQLALSWLAPVVTVNTLEPGDDFETGDFSYMPWIMGGDADWTIDTIDPYQGSYCAKSGTIGDSQTSTMEFTVDTTGYYGIGFYMKTSTEANDKLRFYDNGDPHGLFNGSGELDWDYFFFSVTSGTHTFKWAYEKDGSGSSGSDCVWIDKIEFIAY
ncbi:MAG: hypothetical protein JW860_08735 [Sedimentisphaerales bacterium]|nr:hypothetical protein [Sedimentisphaerales bacterium]